ARLLRRLAIGFMLISHPHGIGMKTFTRQDLLPEETGPVAAVLKWPRIGAEIPKRGLGIGKIESIHPAIPFYQAAFLVKQTILEAQLKVGCDVLTIASHHKIHGFVGTQQLFIL